MPMQKHLKFKSGNKISPLKLLYDKSKKVICVKFPNDAGIDPVKLLIDRIR